MVRVPVTAEVPLTVTVNGETVQLAPGGQVPPMLRATGPVNPYRGVMVIVDVPDCPGERVIDGGFADIVKSVTSSVTGEVVDPA